MKILAIPFLYSVLLYGQTPAQPQQPVKVTPGSPAVNAPAEAATPAPSLPPETVVAEVNGKKYTAADLDKLIDMLPSQYQQAARAQPKLLSQIFLMQRLAEDAQKAGLDQREPFKDQLEMARVQVLSNAQLSEVTNSMQITEAEEKKYYKENPDKFKQVKIRVIYIAFNPTPGKAATGGKKLLTEAEAESKIEDLEKQIKAGADFGKLARENSDDQASAAKDGDFGEMKSESTYPPAIKTAVFALKQGEVSAPIKQPNGFYLIRAEEISQQAFDETIIPIAQAVKQDKFQEWLKGMQSQYSVKVENPAYFAPRVPAQLQQVH
jgi:peptidyl-prolyl cis-trans isomerase C